jgi:hypothetical protein
MAEYDFRQVEIEGDYFARMEHVGLLNKVSVDGLRTYADDDPETPAAWRIYYDCDRTQWHMPAEWAAERVKETFLWYLRGEKEGERFGIKKGKSDIKYAIAELRELGIGTLLLPTPVED